MKKFRKPIKVQYFRWDEIVTHNLADDIWVVIHGNVFDLTRLMLDRKDTINLVGEISESSINLKLLAMIYLIRPLFKS
jgi:hypothetical protein